MNESDVTKQIRLILPGTLSTKKNSRQPVPVPSQNITRIKAAFGKRMIWRYVRILLLPSKQYKAWETQARAEIIRQLPAGFPPMQGPIEVAAVIYWKGHEPDLSGATESVGDCLQGLVFENDRQIKSWDGSRVIHDKANPRTEVEVREIDVMPLFNHR